MQIDQLLPSKATVAKGAHGLITSAHVHNIRQGVKFTGMDIRTRFKVFTGCDDICVGYKNQVMAGKGKQMWFNSDEDITFSVVK